MPHVNKNFARLEKIFLHINFSLSQKQRYEQKPLAPLFTFIQHQNHSNFFHKFHFALQKSLQ